MVPSRTSHPIISPPPGGPCSHHPSGQPSAVYVCQGDRGLWNAQGQGVYVPIPPQPWAQPLCSRTVSSPTGTVSRVLMSIQSISGVGQLPRAGGAWGLVAPYGTGSRPGFGVPSARPCAGLISVLPLQAQALVQYLEEPLTQVAAS